MFRKIIVICLWLFLFLLFFHQETRPEDAWWHLSTGRWIVGHWQVPHVDPFPFTNEQTPWTQHNEWLGSTILYFAYQLGGFLGLKIFRSLIFILAISVFFFYARKRLPLSFIVILMLLMAYGIFNRPLLKPELFNLIFVQVFLITLFAYVNNGKLKNLLILPVLGVFWFNIHIGAVVYGVPLIAIFLIAACIKFFNYQRKGEVSNKNAAAIQIKHITGVLFLYLMGFLINPYGLQGFLFPFKVFLIPSYIDFYKQCHMTAEMQPPWYIFMSFNYFYFFILAGLALFAVFLKKDRIQSILLLAISLFAFLCVERNSSFFTLACVYIIIDGARNLNYEETWRKVRFPQLLEILMMAAIGIFLVIQIVNLWGENVSVEGKRSKSLFLQVNPYVLSSINFLKENGITGPAFNDIPLGNSMLWFCYPQLRPFDDGRHVNTERFNDRVAVILRPEIYWSQVEKEYGFKVLIAFQAGSSENLIKYIDSRPDWQLVAVDGRIVIYVKRGAFHLSEKLDQFQQQLRSEIVTDHDKIQLESLLQRKPRSLLERFLDPSPIEVDSFSAGRVLMSLGYKGAALKDFIDGLKVSDQLYMKQTAVVFLKQLSH